MVAAPQEPGPKHRSAGHSHSWLVEAREVYVCGCCQGELPCQHVQNVPCILASVEFNIGWEEAHELRWGWGQQGVELRGDRQNMCIVVGMTWMQVGP